MQKPRTARNPAGIVKARPIALRLMPEELAEAERIAAQRNCSKSALARRAYLAGLKLIEPQSERGQGYHLAIAGCRGSADGQRHGQKPPDPNPRRTDRGGMARGIASP